MPPKQEFKSKSIWRGHYEQNGQMTEMIFKRFSAELGGELLGCGNDAVGEFFVRGALNQQGSVSFVKQYVGKHSVNYNG